MKSHPKAHFSSRLQSGDYLSFSIWPGKKDPKAEVLTIQIRRSNSGVWETVESLAIYRTATGDYSQLPERSQQMRVEGVGVKKDEDVEEDERGF
ncbi:hypothetical protein MUP77_21635 [Candidatus Bathyarchaeota archaeon]|nr:hypothetical protein [Candidatus Bathyarchaeota archaeon]